GRWRWGEGEGESSGGDSGTPSTGCGEDRPLQLSDKRSVGNPSRPAIPLDLCPCQVEERAHDLRRDRAERRRKRERHKREKKTDRKRETEENQEREGEREGRSL